MNGVLFRRSARSLWKTWVVFAAVLSLYVSMITAMFAPKLNATLDEIVTAMPQLMNMVGMQAGSSSLGGFLINYLYGFLLLLLPLVFSILAANRLVARWVDTGRVAYLLASTTARARGARRVTGRRESSVSMLRELFLDRGTGGGAAGRESTVNRASASSAPPGARGSGRSKPETETAHSSRTPSGRRGQTHCTSPSRVRRVRKVTPPRSRRACTIPCRVTARLFRPTTAASNFVARTSMPITPFCKKE